MKYIVVTALSVSKLEDLVQDRIAKGWEPLGGVAVIEDLWVQAMVLVVK